MRGVRSSPLLGLKDRITIDQYSPPSLLLLIELSDLVDCLNRVSYAETEPSMGVDLLGN